MGGSPTTYAASHVRTFVGRVSARSDRFVKADARGGRYVAFQIVASASPRGLLRENSQIIAELWPLPLPSKV